MFCFSFSCSDHSHLNCSWLISQLHFFCLPALACLGGLVLWAARQQPKAETGSRLRARSYSRPSVSSTTPRIHSAYFPNCKMYIFVLARKFVHITKRYFWKIKIRRKKSSLRAISVSPTNPWIQSGFMVFGNTAFTLGWPFLMDFTLDKLSFWCLPNVCLNNFSQHFVWIALPCLCWCFHKGSNFRRSQGQTEQ